MPRQFKQGKLFRKNSMNVKTTNDMLLELIPIFRSLYNTDKMPKNDSFVKEVILQLQKYPNLIEPLNTRVRGILAPGIKDDTARYIRFILNEDVLDYVEKPVKTKKPATAQAAAEPAAPAYPRALLVVFERTQQLNHAS